MKKSFWNERKYQDPIKQLLVTLVILLPLGMLWADWYQYLDDLAIKYDSFKSIIEDPIEQIIVLLGLLALQWLPLYIIFRLSLFVIEFTSYRFNWKYGMVK